jgi:hypothetical protein
LIPSFLIIIIPILNEKGSRLTSLTVKKSVVDFDLHGAKTNKWGSSREQPGESKEILINLEFVRKI